MNKQTPKRSKKSGLPPGSLVHIGEKKSDTIRITVIDYDEQGFREKELATLEECFLFKKSPSVTWINIDGLHDTGLITKLGECYGFHPLMLEDIANTQQRPKMDDYTDYLYVVLRMLYLNQSAGIMTEQVSLVAGSNFVISFQEAMEGDVFNPVRESIRTDKNRVRRMGADYLLYLLIDAVVDSYFAILETMGEEIESTEDMLILNPEAHSLQAIHTLKRKLIVLRKAIWPLRELINKLERNESSLLQDHTRLYLRDVYDHTIQVIDTVETYRDMVSGMIDIYLSSVSNRMNAVMKVLTIIATIFMPLTFLAGVYGMNFKHMPELEWPWAYPALWGVMLGISLLMLYFFHRKKWL
ncbi:MAG: magnesium/cobalt transporter CorA [Thermodesulfovibrionales bacterium]